VKKYYAVFEHATKKTIREKSFLPGWKQVKETLNTCINQSGGKKLPARLETGKGNFERVH
jgi:hypothetical protein